ncbi:MAG: hypothetical protein IKX00_02875 [Bacilli bacterium]|nr:hypothetical protein [Bacilli bacterium]
MTPELAKGHNNIIQDYKVDKYLIHVNYTDGHTECVELLEYNKEKIINEMLKQAEKIVKEKTSEEYYEERKTNIIEVCFTSLVMAAIASLSVEIYNGSVDYKRLLVEAIISLAVPVITYTVIKNNQKNDDKEVKKYQLFIENYEDFKNNANKGLLYEGINKKGWIDINNLDKYTYEEVDRMLQNVRKRTNN